MFKTLLISALCATLVACGGGGGSGPLPTMTCHPDTHPCMQWYSADYAHVYLVLRNDLLVFSNSPLTNWQGEAIEQVK